MRATKDFEVTISDENICAAFNQLEFDVCGTIEAKATEDDYGVPRSPTFITIEDEKVDYPVELVFDDKIETLTRKELVERVGEDMVHRLEKAIFDNVDSDDFVIEEQDYD